MITIKQPEGSKSCGAAVAAMITGQTLEEVLAGREDTCLSTTAALARYLMDHGWMMGAGLVPRTNRLNSTEFSSLIDIQDKYAIMAVDSQTHPDWGHWVLWDGKEGFVRDPNPLIGEKRILTSLKVREVWLLNDLRGL